ncbi:beta-1,3-galactosyltransferase 9 [Sphaerodactylus townsendi]|uniref:beta-1,3-galactosyltransferase 9 n=1 Tax=Sphaerodactylus townsendi TaxID=933632 RepID=UPI002025EAC1|nr:beta-1,3-galactosyltransferase 9 [Sphaerodactylus townsendi]
MQLTFCRLRTHQCCFILFNIALFHVLLFGADLVEEYFLRGLSTTYTDMRMLDVRERARKLDMSPLKPNISKAYILSSSDACIHKEVFLLVLTFSHPENASRRNTIRQTWANATDIRGYSAVILFVLGKPSSETTQLEIMKEFQEHRDLIEGSFLDSPKNQTLKTTKAVEWSVTFCPGARFILKTDEEMFVNLANLVDYLLSLRTRLENVYLGRVVHHEVPNRDPQSPNFVPLQIYPEKYYSDYCSPTAFVISQDVARMIYVTSPEVPLSMPPGVFVGTCTKNAGVTPIHSSRFSGKKHIQYNQCCYKFIFTSAVSRDSQLVREWEEVSDGKACTLLETYYGLVSCRVMTYLDGFKHLGVDALQNEALHFAD